MKKTNMVFLCGRIVHLFVGKACVIMTIKTAPRNYPKVVMFGALAEEAKEYAVGDCVSADCYIVSSQCDRGMTYSVFGKSLQRVCSEAKWCSDFYLSGIVTSRRDVGRFCNLMLMVNDNGHLEEIPVALPGALVPQLKRGCTVNLLGEVRTTQKMKDGVQKYYQNYIGTHVLA